MVTEFLNAHPDVDVLNGEAHHIDADDPVLEAYPAEPFSWEGSSKPALSASRQLSSGTGSLNDLEHSILRIRIRWIINFWIRWAKAGLNICRSF